MARITFLLNLPIKASRVFGGLVFICCLLAGVICRSQPELLEFSSKSCPSEVLMPYHFEKSLASIRLLNHSVFDKELSNDTLFISLGVYGYCNSGDTYGVRVSGDTLFLQYGPKTYPDDDGFQIEVDLCLCMLKFDYKVTGIDTDNTNLIAVEDIAFGYKSQPFDVINSNKMSLHYPPEVDLKYEFMEYVREAKTHYANLLPLYEGIQVNMDDESWNNSFGKINEEWKALLNNIRAVKDPYVEIHLDSDTYDFLLKNFNKEMQVITTLLQEEYDRLAELGVIAVFDRPIQKIPKDQ